MKQLAKYPHLNWYVSNLKSIPGGTYRWGASPALKQPGTRITMSSFRLGATPVTWGMWKEYCKSESVGLPKQPFWGYPDNHPVVLVSYKDVMSSSGFCAWASATAGFKLTLPTDAQWEYAARGGRDGLDYPWGNEFDTSRLWCSSESGTAAVDRTKRMYRNGYGLSDMLGNVYQFCSDYFSFDFQATGIDPVDKKRNELEWRCARGGSWVDTNGLMEFKCASRAIAINMPMHMYGFRLSAGPK
jgi:sulfatase modifying factor 1